MLRAVVVSGTTVVGVGAVLALNPTGTTTSALKIATVKPASAEGSVVYGPNAPAVGPSSATPQTPAPSTSPTASYAATQPVSHSTRRASAAPTRSTAPAPTPSHTVGPTSSTATVAPPSASQAPAPSPSAPTSATALGQPVDVGYGIVQVQATVSGGKLVDVQAVQLPYDNPYSQQVSYQAWPLLKQQALQSQSSQIAGVSGATYTTWGFEQSLRSALLRLGHSA